MTVADHGRDSHQCDNDLVVVRRAGHGAKPRHLGRELLARDRMEGILVPLRELAHEGVAVGPPFFGSHGGKRLRLRRADDTG